MTQESRVPAIRNETQKLEASGIAGLARGAPDNQTVRKGKTLTQISRRYKLQVKHLHEINEFKGSKLKIGRVSRLKEEREGEEEVEGDLTELEQEPFLTQAKSLAFRVLEDVEPPEEKGDRTLVHVAQNFLGVKYRWGGTSLIHGLDCSAFVQKVFRVMGMDLPRTVREQFEVGLEVARDALWLGDLVFFKTKKARYPTHVGIYMGNNQFIHTSRVKRKVNIESLNNRYFSPRFMGGRRIEEDCGSY